MTYLMILYGHVTACDKVIWSCDKAVPSCDRLQRRNLNFRANKRNKASSEREARVARCHEMAAL